MLNKIYKKILFYIRKTIFWGLIAVFIYSQFIIDYSFNYGTTRYETDKYYYDIPNKYLVIYGNMPEHKWLYYFPISLEIVIVASMFLKETLEFSNLMLKIHINELPNYKIKYSPYKLEKSYIKIDTENFYPFDPNSAPNPKIGPILTKRSYRLNFLSYPYDDSNIKKSLELRNNSKYEYHYRQKPIKGFLEEDLLDEYIFSFDIEDKEYQITDKDWSIEISKDFPPLYLKYFNYEDPNRKLNYTECALNFYIDTHKVRLSASEEICYTSMEEELMSAIRSMFEKWRVKKHK